MVVRRENIIRPGWHPVTTRTRATPRIIIEDQNQPGHDEIPELFDGDCEIGFALLENTCRGIWGTQTTEDVNGNVTYKFPMSVIHDPYYIRHLAEICQATELSLALLDLRIREIEVRGNRRAFRLANSLPDDRRITGILLSFLPYYRRGGGVAMQNMNGQAFDLLHDIDQDEDETTERSLHYIIFWGSFPNLEYWNVTEGCQVMVMYDIVLNFENAVEHSASLPTPSKRYTSLTDAVRLAKSASLLDLARSDDRARKTRARIPFYNPHIQNQMPTLPILTLSSKSTRLNPLQDRLRPSAVASQGIPNPFFHTPMSDSQKEILDKTQSCQSDILDETQSSGELGDSTY